MQRLTLAGILLVAEITTLEVLLTLVLPLLQPPVETPDLQQERLLHRLHQLRVQQ